MVQVGHAATSLDISLGAARYVPVENRNKLGCGNPMVLEDRPRTCSLFCSHEKNGDFSGMEVGGVRGI